jgi:hypothetical protein
VSSKRDSKAKTLSLVVMEIRVCEGGRNCLRGLAGHALGMQHGVRAGRTGHRMRRGALYCMWVNRVCTAVLYTELCRACRH